MVRAANGQEVVQRYSVSFYWRQEEWKLKRHEKVEFKRLWLQHCTRIVLSLFGTMESYIYVGLGLITFWWFFLRPRGGGKNAPTLVTKSKLVPLPFIGVVAEFLKSPNDMMKRCYDDFGEVFTIPVSFLPFL
jgi:hypothetical protein